MEILDGQIVWDFDESKSGRSITATSGSKCLLVTWYDDFSITIYDNNDYDIVFENNTDIDFIIPSNSKFYHLFQQTILDNYTIYGDEKPEDSQKRVEFHYEDTGLKIYIYSDYMKDFDIAATSVLFYGFLGGSSQKDRNIDNFVNLLKKLFEFVKNKSDERDLDNSKNFVKKV